MVRAPGGQLITAHQDRGGGRQARRRRGQPFRPRPDAGARRSVPGLRAAQRRRLPARCAGLAEALAGVTLGWAIAYNTELVKNPPKTWMDLTKPEYKDKKIGQVVGPSGGTTWTRIMFERQVLGEDYWKKQAALGIALYPVRRADLRRAGARRDLDRAAALQHHLHQDRRRSAGRGDLRARGRADHPLRRRHHQDVEEPERRQAVHELAPSARKARPSPSRSLGNITSLKEPPLFPKGWDPEGDQGLGAEVRRVREAARRLARGVEQDLRLPPVNTVHPRTSLGMAWSERDSALNLVRKRFATGQAGGRRRELRRAGGRDRGPARPLGLRQDHDLALRRRAGASDRRPHLDRRSRRVRTRARPAGPPARARHRHGVPVLRGVAAHDGAPERGLSAEAPPQATAAATSPPRSTRRSSWSASAIMPSGR